MKHTEKKIKPVDVTNDAQMVAEGLRQPMYEGRNMSLWQKTEKERALWHRYRNYPAPTGNWAKPIKDARYKAKLIVNVTGLEKTTFSHVCSFEDLGYLLSKYKTENSTIVKAFWNGKQIDPEGLHKAEL